MLGHAYQHHCAERRRNHTVMARYYETREPHLWSTPHPMRHSLDAKVCVARNAGFNTRFDTERPLKLQKSPHETPCRGTAFGRTTWSARSLFLLTLFDPSLLKKSTRPRGMFRCGTPHVTACSVRPSPRFFVLRHAYLDRAENRLFFRVPEMGARSAWGARSAPEGRREAPRSGAGCRAAAQSAAAGG